MTDYDVIVIGSGFGGSVMTCRLAEKGYHVCLLERGKEYDMGDFPRRIDELKNAVWDPKDDKHGLFEVLAHPDSDVFSVSASGLGGGSLIYSNVSLAMDPESFQGWPGDIDYETIAPYYKKVQDTMEVARYPLNDPDYQDTVKTNLIQNSVAQLPQEPEAKNKPDGFLPHLAVWFKGKKPGEQSENMHGRLQSKCTRCGECNVGCNIHAKNTLDLNYLARARNQERLPPDGKVAEIITQAHVTDIKPLDDKTGYSVTYSSVAEQDKHTNHQLTAKKVIVACGAVGSPGLLGKLKKKGSLPKLSDALGKSWCGNGDLEATIIDSQHDFSMSDGPVITYSIKHMYNPYPDGFPHSIHIQDGGIPPFLSWYIVGKIPSPSLLLNFIKLVWKKILFIFKKSPEINIGDDIVDLIKNDKYLRHALILLCMGRDRSDGHVYINDNNDVVINWKIDKSSLHVKRQIAAMENLASALKGKLLINPLTYLDKLIVVHPLGGCVMADNQSHGVVDTNGEVFNYPGLYVVDGSIIPTSTGPNPSLTIAAMAEFIADKFEHNCD